MPNSAISFNTSGLASATSPGLVGTGAQTFAGNKTFNGLVSASGGIINTGLTGANATTVTTSGSGKVGEIIQKVNSVVNPISNGAWRTGTGMTLQAGIWLVRVKIVASTVAPTSLNVGITNAVNSAPIVDSMNFTTQVGMSDFGNTTSTMEGNTAGYFVVASASTYYPVIFINSPTSSSYGIDFLIGAIRIA